MLLSFTLDFPIFSPASYNALLFQITPAHSSYQLLLAESFFEAKPYSLSTTNITTALSILLPPSAHSGNWPNSWPGVSPLRTSLDNLQESPSDPVGWRQTSFDHCEKTYRQPFRQHTGNVVLTTQWNMTNETILGIGYLDFHTTYLNTLCPMAFYDSTANSSGLLAAQKHYGQSFDEISSGINGHEKVICPVYDPKNRNYKPDPSTIPTVSTCFQEVDQVGLCRLGYNNTFLLVITICLGVKTFCMLLMIIVIRSQPLYCLGDVIAEYLRSPDLSTIGCSYFNGLLTSAQPTKDRCPSAAQSFQHFKYSGFVWIGLGCAFMIAWTFLMNLSALYANDVPHDQK